MNKALRQASRFLAVGMLNSAIGLTIIWMAMFFGASPLPANAIGYAVGLCVSFVLNKSWTFANGNEQVQVPTLVAATRFCVAFAISWPLNALVVWLGMAHTNMSPYILQVFGVVTYSVTFFIICKIWVFEGSHTEKNKATPFYGE